MPSIGEVIQQKAFESARQQVLINLIYSGGWAKHMSASTLKGLNLTWQQFNLMRILQGQKGKPATLGVLADRMLDPQSNASRLVVKLVEKGWIDREECASDRRQVLLTLTAEGKQVLAQASERVRQAYSEIGGDLTEQELVQLSDLLDRFRNPSQ